MQGLYIKRRLCRSHMHTHEQSATPCSDPTQRNLCPASRCSDVRERNQAEDPSIGPSVPSWSWWPHIRPAPNGSRRTRSRAAAAAGWGSAETRTGTGSLPASWPVWDAAEGIPGALSPMCDGFRRLVSCPVDSGCVKSRVNRESWIARCGRSLKACTDWGGKAHGSRNRVFAPVGSPAHLVPPTPVSHPPADCAHCVRGAFDVQMKPFIIILTTAKQQ